MPWDRFSHTTVSTISAAITTGTLPLTVHSSTNRMKDATGVARITRIAGDSSRSARGSQLVSTASALPISKPQPIPCSTRHRDRPTLPQNSPWPHSRHSAWATVWG